MSTLLPGLGTPCSYGLLITELPCNLRKQSDAKLSYELPRQLHEPGRA
jgi:hypothetical protein